MSLTPEQARARFVLRLAQIMNPDQVEVEGTPRRTGVAKAAPSSPAPRRRTKRTNSQ